MENKIDLSASVNPYLKQFQVAQLNLVRIIEEERLNKRVQRSKRKLLRPL